MLRPQLGFRSVSPSTFHLRNAHHDHPFQSLTLIRSCSSSATNVTWSLACDSRAHHCWCLRCLGSPAKCRSQEVLYAQKPDSLGQTLDPWTNDRIVRHCTHPIGFCTISSHLADHPTPWWCRILEAQFGYCRDRCRLIGLCSASRILLVCSLAGGCSSFSRGWLNPKSFDS